MNESNTPDLSGAPSETSAESVGMVAGLFKSLTNLASTLIVLAQTRLELLTTELQEEVQRAAGLIVWSFIAFLTAMMGLFFGAMTIVVIYWDEHRILAASLVTGVFLLLAAIAIAVLIVKVHSRPRFLDATLAELKKDAESLKSRAGQ